MVSVDFDLDRVGRPRIEQIGIDARVLAFTLVVSLATGLVFGLAPALQASRLDIVTALKTEDTLARSGSRRSRLRAAFVTAQVTLSVVLLVCAGLLLRTLQALYAVPPGYATREVLLASVDVALQGYDEGRGRAFYAELERRAGGLPGVRSAALARMVPLGGGGMDSRIFPAETAPAPDDEGLKTDLNAVTPGYFATLGIPILHGRGFGAGDDARAPAVAIVNEALAERLWPGEDRVGRRFRNGRRANDEVLEVIGVVPTAKYRALVERERPFFYRPLAQMYMPSLTLHVRSDGDARALASLVERTVAALDPDLPVYGVETLADRLADSLGQQRVLALLAGIYGALALALAGVGLYGVLAIAVAQRRREIGVRVALGATRRQVVGVIVGQGARLALRGIAIGLLVALFATRLLADLLYEVRPHDLATFIAIPALLAAVALVASWLPAMAAARVAPQAALRAE